MNPQGWRSVPTGIEDYAIEATQPRIPVRAGQDIQPTGWVGTLVLSLIGAGVGTICLLALTGGA